MPCVASRPPRSPQRRLRQIPARSPRPEEAIVKTQKEQQDEKRRTKLAEVERQVESGSLVVRQMTADERERNPPRPRKPKRA